MMLRERKGKLKPWVLCIRTIYDPASKRGRQEVVAKFDPYADSLPSDVAAALTEAERGQAEQWIADRLAKRESYRLPYLCQHTARYADELSSALNDPERAPAVLSGLDAEVLYAALDRVTKALRKHGKGRPAPKKPAETGETPSPTPLEDAIAAAQENG